MMTPEQWTQSLRARSGPAWRWQQAHSWAQRPHLGQPHVQDPEIHAAATFLTGSDPRDDTVRTAQRLAPVGAAQQLEANLPLAANGKILVIGNCPLPEVAGLLDLPEETVQTWEALFFDVRPALPAVDWIFSRVIQAERAAGKQALAAQLKLAYAGGPVAARALLRSGKGLPMAAAEAWFDRKLRLHLRVDQALVMAAAADPFALVQHHSLVLVQEKKLELARLKLQERCRAALARDESARQRQQCQEERRCQQVAARNGRRTAREQALQRLAQRRLERLHAERQQALAQRLTGPLAQLGWATGEPSHEWIALAKSSSTGMTARTSHLALSEKEVDLRWRNLAEPVALPIPA
jgi:hypothetical protein